MNLDAFSEFKTGRLVPITFHDRNDHAFIPSGLPPASIDYVSLYDLLLIARVRLERLSAISSQLPDVTLILRPLQRREAITSNSLEGTFVTPQELLLFEAAAAERAPSDQPEPRDDWREVFEYDRALRQGCEWIRANRLLDNSLICELHGLLLRASARGREKSPGQFRAKQVVVGRERRYFPPPATELAELLANFEASLTPPPNVDPLVWAYIVHYQFEAIHPFEDGNGRIGRLVLALCAYKWLGLETPCLYMSEFFERNRKDYIQTLFRVSTHGEWNEWVTLCLQGTIEQAEASIRRCNALRALKKRYEDALGADSGRPRALLDGLFRQPFLSVVDVQKRFDVSYRAARNALERLVGADIVREMQNHYPKTYVAQEIFNAAYVD